MKRLPIDEAIRSRRAVRQFLRTPAPLATVRELVALASRAPSAEFATLTGFA